MTKPTEPGRGRELGPVEPHRPEQASGPGAPLIRPLPQYGPGTAWGRRLVPRAQVAADNARTLGRLSDAAKIAEQVNPGRVVYVAVVEDIEGVPCEIAADYQSVLIGPYRFPRDRMPELWAAIGEAAWLAGTIEQAIREEDDQAGPFDLNANTCRCGHSSAIHGPACSDPACPCDEWRK